MQPKKLLDDFFAGEHIDAYAVLSYVDCREIAPSVMARESFLPKSVILYLLPYYGGETVNLSRYAASRDYHIAIRGVNDRLSARMHAAFPGCSLHGYGDHSPIDEVGAALVAGLGIRGDNGLILHPVYGSYVFIGDMISDIEPALLGAVPPTPVRSCEHCGACRRACPTGILRGEGSDCLSAITQKKGELSDEEKNLMRKFNTGWGCDLCQSVCPHNRHPVLSPVPFFREDRIPELTSDLLASMDKAAFSERAFAWRGRKTVERNLSILEGNEGKD